MGLAAGTRLDLAHWLCTTDRNHTHHSMLITPSNVLALDLEGTLISNAMSQIPRPGLHAFLSRCRELFTRIVMFTTVDEASFRKIAQSLVEEGFAPDWFATLECVQWHGETKDLRFVMDANWQEVILVDDFEKFVHPGQEAQWLQIVHFDYPYPQSDTGLMQTLITLESWAPSN